MAVYLVECAVRDRHRDAEALISGAKRKEFRIGPTRTYGRRAARDGPLFYYFFFA